MIFLSNVNIELRCIACSQKRFIGLPYTMGTNALLRKIKEHRCGSCHKGMELAKANFKLTDEDCNMYG